MSGLRWPKLLQLELPSSISSGGNSQLAFDWCFRLSEKAKVWIFINDLIKFLNGNWKPRKKACTFWGSTLLGCLCWEAIGREEERRERLREGSAWGIWKLNEQLISELCFCVFVFSYPYGLSFMAENAWSCLTNKVKIMNKYPHVPSIIGWNSTCA